MIEVTKAQFSSAIGGPENINPRPERDHSAWEIVGTRQLIGKTTPGYMGGSPGEPKRYYLTPEFAARKGIKAEGGAA